MYFKVGEIRPFVINNEIQYGKILKVNIEEETYLLEDIDTKIKYEVNADNVFIGDD